MPSFVSSSGSGRVGTWASNPETTDIQTSRGKTTCHRHAIYSFWAWPWRPPDAERPHRTRRPKSGLCARSLSTPEPVDDDRSAVGEIKPRYESDLASASPARSSRALVDVGVLGQEGRLLARLDEQDYRNKLQSAEADIVGGAGRADGGARRRRTGCASCWRTAPRRAPTTTRRSRTCARPRPSSTRPRPPLDLAKDQLSYTRAARRLRRHHHGRRRRGRARSSMSARWSCGWREPDEKDAVFAIAESAFASRHRPTSSPRSSSRC